jgi:hypothetical protein
MVDVPPASRRRFLTISFASLGLAAIGSAALAAPGQGAIVAAA